MRIKVLGLAAVSSLSLIGFSTPAFAGGCGVGVPAANCGMGVNVVPSTQPVFDPMTVHTRHPMGHLRTVQFQRAPNVSITRIHGMGPSAGLSDAPSGFTGGCFPTSTNYCRTDVGTPVSVDLNPAHIAMPYIGTAPVMPAPIISQPLRTWTGQGFDPSKFQPRQYGENTFTPGIAHIPTSIVDRDPIRADMALNSGRAMPQPIANGGMAPRPHMMMGPQAYGLTLPPTMAPSMGSAMGSSNYSLTLPPTMAPVMGGITLPPTYAQGPAMGGYSGPMMGAPMMGGQATAPVLTQNGTYASNVGADGTYWEKTSGPTMFGNTMATQVICKRKLPTQVVNPVVNVPYAVPTPVPTCGPVSHNVHPGHNARYGATSGRWTY